MFLFGKQAYAITHFLGRISAAIHAGASGEEKAYTNVFEKFEEYLKRNKIYIGNTCATFEPNFGPLADAARTLYTFCEGLSLTEKDCQKGLKSSPSPRDAQRIASDIKKFKETVISTGGGILLVAIKGAEKAHSAIVAKHGVVQPEKLEQLLRCSGIEQKGGWPWWEKQKSNFKSGYLQGMVNRCEKTDWSGKTSLDRLEKCEKELRQIYSPESTIEPGATQ